MGRKVWPWICCSVISYVRVRCKACSSFPETRLFLRGPGKSGKEGLWEASKQFPKATEALARFVRQAKPAFKFSAIMMFKDIKTPMHRDSRNAPFPNLVIPIGDFKGGEIW